MSHRPAQPWAAAFDLATILMMMFLILALTERPATPPTVTTLGSYAITASWKDGSNDDADLYVRDPEGRIVYFASTSVGLMHLEHDDLGTLVSGTAAGVVVKQNGERVVIRGAEPGEYVVDVHMYADNDHDQLPVKVQLWSLRGEDRAVKTATVLLARRGAYGTAFRFSLNTRGEITNTNTLPLDIVHTVGAGQSTTPPQASR